MNPIFTLKQLGEKVQEAECVYRFYGLGKGICDTVDKEVLWKVMRIYNVNSNL